MGHTNHWPDSSLSSEELFGDSLRRLRRVAGLTQSELADRANLSLRGLSDLERSITRHPRRETVLALADALRLDDQARLHFLEVARRRPADLSVSSSALSPSSIVDPGKPTWDPLRPSGLPTGTVTFLFTDIEGSTKLLQRLGPTYATVLAEHQRLMRESWAEYGVWFVRLSRLTDPERVLPTIAHTLGLKDTLGQPIAQTLSEYLFAHSGS